MKRNDKKKNLPLHPAIITIEVTTTRRKRRRRNTIIDLRRRRNILPHRRRRNRLRRRRNRRLHRRRRRRNRRLHRPRCPNPLKTLTRSTCVPTIVPLTNREATILPCLAPLAGRCFTRNASTSTPTVGSPTLSSVRNAASNLHHPRMVPNRRKPVPLLPRSLKRVGVLWRKKETARELVM